MINTHPTPETEPVISVVVPTRNRAQHALACARSILATTGFSELIFVDQSDGLDTRLALETVGDDRLLYVHSMSRGATSGRNIGIERSRGDVIAFTDDDCRVDADWVSNIARIFSTDAAAAIICGRVTVPEEIGRHGFAIGFEPETREWQHRYPPPGKDWGITANFAARRRVFEQIGMFDPVLGPGAPLLCGEEPDILFRTLKAGMKVVNANEVHVEHLGVRAHGEESRALWDTYAAGTAAALIKHVRLGDPQGARLYAKWLGQSGWRVIKSLLSGTRPTGARFLKAFLKGSVSSWSFDIDRNRKIYEKRKTKP